LTPGSLRASEIKHMLNIWLFLSNIRVFQKQQNLWVAKVLMTSYILGKILSFQARVAQEVFNTSGLYSMAEVIIL